eukprot:m.140579 g.140579  ORF g.140579 m.140579 type:complete len:438 (-) comp14037_c0_seq4:5770-7083(-)
MGVLAHQLWKSSGKSKLRARSLADISGSLQACCRNIHRRRGSHCGNVCHVQIGRDLSKHVNSALGELPQLFNGLANAFGGDPAVHRLDKRPRLPADPVRSKQQQRQRSLEVGPDRQQRRRLGVRPSEQIIVGWIDLVGNRLARLDAADGFVQDGEVEAHPLAHGLVSSAEHQGDPAAVHRAQHSPDPIGAFRQSVHHVEEPPERVDSPRPGATPVRAHYRRNVRESLTITRADHRRSVAVTKREPPAATADGARRKGIVVQTERPGGERQGAVVERGEGVVEHPHRLHQGHVGPCLHNIPSHLPKLAQNVLDHQVFPRGLGRREDPAGKHTPRFHIAEVVETPLHRDKEHVKVAGVTQERDGGETAEELGEEAVDGVVSVLHPPVGLPIPEVRCNPLPNRVGLRTDNPTARGEVNSVGVDRGNRPVAPRLALLHKPR